MSNSYKFRKKTDYIVYLNNACSDRERKRFANRALRHKARQRILACRDYDCLVMPVIDEVSDRWEFKCDGSFVVKPGDRYYEIAKRK
jgi:hypothetical protein